MGGLIAYVVLGVLVSAASTTLYVNWKVLTNNRTFSSRPDNADIGFHTALSFALWPFMLLYYGNLYLSYRVCLYKKQQKK